MDEELRRLERAFDSGDVGAATRLVALLQAGKGDSPPGRFNYLVQDGMRNGDIAWPSKFVSAMLLSGKIDFQQVIAAETLGRSFFDLRGPADDNPAPPIFSDPTWPRYAQRLRDMLGTTMLAQVARDVCDRHTGGCIDIRQAQAYARAAMRNPPRQAGWILAENSGGEHFSHDGMWLAPNTGPALDLLEKTYTSACMRREVAVDKFDIRIGVMGCPGFGATPTDAQTNEMLWWGVRNLARQGRRWATGTMIAARWFSPALYFWILSGVGIDPFEAFPGSEDMLGEAVEEGHAEGNEQLAGWALPEHTLISSLLGGDYNLTQTLPVESKHTYRTCMSCDAELNMDDDWSDEQGWEGECRRCRIGEEE